jgi:hypothetical protein
MLQRGNTAWTLQRPGLSESQPEQGTPENDLRKREIPFFYAVGGSESLTTGRRSVRSAFPRRSVGTIKVFLDKKLSVKGGRD